MREFDFIFKDIENKGMFLFCLFNFYVYLKTLKYKHIPK